MTDLNPFEKELARRLEAEASRGLRVFDPAAIARSAMGRRGLLDNLVNRVGIGSRLAAGPLPRQAVMVMLLGLLLAAALIALGVGAFLAHTRPSGSDLAILGEDSVRLENSDGSGARTLYHATNGERLDALAWAPGGDHIAIHALTSDGWALLILDRQGRVTTRLIVQSRVTEFVWSPDGQHLAVLDGRYGPDAAPLVTDAHLDVIDLGGSVVWRPPFPSPFSYVADVPSLAWAPDRAIAIAAQFGQGATTSSSTWLADPGSGTVRQLTPSGTTFDYAPVWSPGGQLYLARDGTEAPEVWEIQPSDGRADRLLTFTWSGCGNPCEPGRLNQILPGRDGQIVVQGFGRLLVYEPESRTKRDLLAGKTDGFPPIAWLDDGMRILFRGLPDPNSAPELLSLALNSGATTVLESGVQSFDLSQPQGQAVDLP